MGAKLKASSQRVQDFLSARGHSFVVRQLPDSTRTAVEAAQAIGCSTGQIAKSLVFRDEATGEPVLVVASGTNRVSAVRVEQATGIRLGKADAAFVREHTGYAIGGVPPVAHVRAVKTLLDPDLQQYDYIWAAAGTPNSVFELPAADLEHLTGGIWVVLAA
ncbi:MAG: YbaK/EbsC family protein [Thiothrix sp.]|nr:YbaK/EbsC family protein [Thiothrix sp.]HPQ95239.1 YbaK/EbsC family protein [Thiolinea sp.]